MSESVLLKIWMVPSSKPIAIFRLGTKKLNSKTTPKGYHVIKTWEPTYRCSGSTGEKSTAVADDGVLMIALVVHSLSHCFHIFTLTQA